MQNERRPKTPVAKKQGDENHRYPSNQHEYEKLMRQDSFRRVRGRLRQTKWTDRT